MDLNNETINNCEQRTGERTHVCRSRWWHVFSVLLFFLSMSWLHYFVKFDVLIALFSENW